MAIRHDQIYKAVQRIPPGSVATYGQIARLIGFPKNARQVGYALAALPNELQIPWHRVVNAKGEISLRAKPGYDEFQRILLEEEGIIFDEKGCISLQLYQWQDETGRQVE